MSVNVGPYSQDLLTRIYNVQWGALAVEFTAEPSYLTMMRPVELAAVSMNKAVISFWFRIPKETAEAVAAATPGVFWEYRVFQGVVPLVTWGAQQTTIVTEVETYDTEAIDVSGGAITLERISGSHNAPLQPSTIGAYVGAYPSFPLTLDVHIQTNAHASGTGLAKIRTSFTGDFLGNDIHTGKPIYDHVVYTETDASSMVTEEPEYLGNSDANSSNSGAGHPAVTVDDWHHLLISWELVSHTNNGGSFCKMWCAIDDKNKDGFDLPAMNNVGFMGMGPNDHMSYLPFSRQGDDNVSVSVEFGTNDVPSNPYQTPGPPSAERASDESGGVVSINPIAKVELAELQIFNDVVLNTSVEKNRRAFIDYERDAEGNIVRDENGKARLKPVNPGSAEELLHKKPEILLHGSSKWIAGENTGTTGVDYSKDPPQIKLDGQFKPTGIIKKYTPDPEIVVA
jgi:hypothetical protein